MTGDYSSPTAMHCICLFLLLIATSFCSEREECQSKNTDFNSDSEDSRSENIEENQNGIRMVPFVAPPVPSEWTNFLTHMTGDSGDVDALVFLFESDVVHPTVAMVDIVCSEKCSGGLFDCSGLVKTCMDRGGFITHESSINAIEGFFKCWVSHRDRGVLGDEKQKITLFSFVAVLASQNEGENYLEDVQIFKLALKHETKLPLEQDMNDYFCSSFWNRGRTKKMHESLDFLLNVYAPIFPCMMLFGLCFGASGFDHHSHPRMLAYEPTPNTQDGWHDLAHILIINGRMHSAFKFAIECLRINAPIDLVRILNSLSNLNLNILPLTALYCSRCTFEDIETAAQESDNISILLMGFDLFMRFKLLMACVEQEEECTCNALKQIFTHNLGKGLGDY